MRAIIRPSNTLKAALAVCAIGILLSALNTQAKQVIDQELREKLKVAISEADSFEDRFDAEVWLIQKSGVLKRFVSDPEERFMVLREIHKASTRSKLPPEYVLALIQVESAFDRFAVSRVGAQGMMQIMPFWKNEIGRKDDNLMDIRTNLKYGCTILRHYLDRSKGNWREAFARYNGSYGKQKYPNKVILAWQKYWK